MTKDLNFSKVDSMEDYEIPLHSLNAKFNYCQKFCLVGVWVTVVIMYELQLRHDCVKENIQAAT